MCDVVTSTSYQSTDSDLKKRVPGPSTQGISLGVNTNARNSILMSSELVCCQLRSTGGIPNVAVVVIIASKEKSPRSAEIHACDTT